MFFTTENLLINHAVNKLNVRIIFDRHGEECWSFPEVRFDVSVRAKESQRDFLLSFAFCLFCLDSKFRFYDGRLLLQLCRRERFVLFLTPSTSHHLFARCVGCLNAYVQRTVDLVQFLQSLELKPNGSNRPDHRRRAFSSLLLSLILGE